MNERVSTRGQPFTILFCIASNRWSVESVTTMRELLSGNSHQGVLNVARFLTAPFLTAPSKVCPDPKPSGFRVLWVNNPG